MLDWRGMSGVLLGAFVFLVFFLGHLAFSHAVAPVNKERTLIRFMLAAGSMYLVAYPGAVGLMRCLTGPAVTLPIVDFLSGAAALGFLVLGYIEFWSLIERSFSLRILIDAAASPHGLTQTEIAARYAQGRGLEWMMAKRIDDLVGSKILVIDGPARRLSPRGRLIGRLFLSLRRLLGIPSAI